MGFSGCASNSIEYFNKIADFTLKIELSSQAQKRPAAMSVSPISCKIQKPIQQIISVCTSPVDLEMHKLNDE